MNRKGTTQGKALTKWENKILRYTEEPPDHLLASPYNWRIHPKAQQDALSAVLTDVGWVVPVICNEVTGHVVDGHLRILLALRREEPMIPVAWVSLTPDEEALVLATLDPLSALATADTEKLDLLLHEVQTGDPALQAMLSDLAEREGLYFGSEDGRDLLDVPEPQLDRAAELQEKWQVKVGDLWGMGRGARCPNCGKWHHLPEGALE
jgi:hypothetical protein